MTKNDGGREEIFIHDGLGITQLWDQMLQTLLIVAIRDKGVVVTYRREMPSRSGKNRIEQSRTLRRSLWHHEGEMAITIAKVYGWAELRDKEAHEMGFL